MKNKTDKYFIHRTLFSSAGLLAVVFIIAAILVSGCATTGRGNFPAFNSGSYSERSLALLPPLGFASNELRGDFMSHLDVSALENTFDTVSVIPSSKVRQILGNNYAGERITHEQGKKIAGSSGADLVLAIWIHDYAVEQFLTTQTRTLYETKTNYRTLIIDSDNSDKNQNGRGPGEGPGKRRGPGNSNGKSSTEAIERRQKTITREIPINENEVRVVLSVSALIYDVQEETVVWRGKRVERSQGKLEYVSSVELTDLVVERIVDRIVDRLTG